MHAAGRGTIKSLEAALKVSAGYFRNRRMKNRMSLDVLLKSLEILGIDPREFFDAAFSRPYKSKTDTAALPAAIKKARDRSRELRKK